MDWIVDWVIAVFVGSGCYSGLKEDSIFILDFGPWTLRNAIADQEQVSRGYRRKGHSGGPVLVGTFFSGSAPSTTTPSPPWRDGASLPSPALSLYPRQT